MNPYFLFAVNGILAWSIRGQIGGLPGGFIAGLLLGSFLMVFSAQPPAQHKLNPAGILLGALVFMWGGEISYGREFDLLASSVPDFKSGLIAITKISLFGAAWGGIGAFGVSHLFKLVLSKKNWIIFLLINLFWILTLWIGFGRIIWISFLFTLFLAWLVTRNDSSFKPMRIFVGIIMLFTAAGFLLSGLLLLLSQWVSFEPLKEIFKLRDQVIGAFVGVGLLFAYRSIQSSLKATIQDVISVRLKWESAGLRNASVKLSYTLFICFFTAIAIAKEALPLWPNKWEWSYSLMLISLGILVVSILQKRVNSYEQRA